MLTSEAVARPTRLLVAIPTLNEARHIERIVRDLLARHRGPAGRAHRRRRRRQHRRHDRHRQPPRAREPARLAVAQSRAHSERGDQPGGARARPRRRRTDSLRRARLLPAQLLPALARRRSTASMPTRSSCRWTRSATAACSARWPGSRTRPSAPAARPIARAGAAASSTMVTTPRFAWTAFRRAGGYDETLHATTRTPSSTAASARWALASTSTPTSASAINRAPASAISGASTFATAAAGRARCAGTPARCGCVSWRCRCIWRCRCWRLGLSPWLPLALAWPAFYVLACWPARRSRSRSRHRDACGLLGRSGCGGHAHGLGVRLLLRAAHAARAALARRDGRAALGGGRLMTTAADAGAPMRACWSTRRCSPHPTTPALTEGLVAAGVAPTWAVRPTRRGDRQEIGADYVDAFFYRRVDRA